MTVKIINVYRMRAGFSDNDFNFGKIFIVEGHSVKQPPPESGHKIFPFAALYFFQRSTQAFCE